MTEQEFISFMGPLAQADMAKSGVLASVTTAQAILESGYGSTELARNANNFFGMKCSLSGNTWPGSTWDGEASTGSRPEKRTRTGTPTQLQQISGNMRALPTVWRTTAHIYWAP